MCVILNIESDCDFPDDKLHLACDINKHGFGLVWWEKNAIKVERDTTDNDPKRIGELLAKLKGNRRLLHLRHATVGDVIPENSHPFLGLSDTLGMMHNGTMYTWKPDKGSKDERLSDSAVFFRDLVEPLATMARKFSGPKYLLENMLFRRVVGDYVLGDNKVVLFSSLGQTLTFNKSKGKDFPGFWASNDYSFDEWHARSSSRPTRTGSHWGGSNNNHPFWNNSNSNSNSMLGGGRGTDLPGTVIQLPSSIKIGNVSDFFRAAHEQLERSKRPSAFNNRGFECSMIAGWVDYAISHINKDSIRSTYMTALPERLEIPRQNFTNLSGITDIRELTKLTEKDLVDMCETFPAAMAAAIIELFCILQVQQINLDRKSGDRNVA